MSASKYIKAQGLPSVVYVALCAEISRELLHEWYHSRPVVFRLLVRGCLAELKDRENENG